MVLIISNIIALIASILMVYSGIVKDKKKILYIQSIQVGLFAICDVLLKGYSGVVINSLSFIRNILCYKDRLGLKEKIILTILSIILILYFNNLGLIGLLPLVSMIFFLWFITVKDIVLFKLLIIIITISWGIYDFSIGSYTPCVFDLFTVVTNLLSILKIKTKTKTCFSDEK